jgi:O-antigen biosynthesis protein
VAPPASFYIVTPSNNLEWLKKAWPSVKAQTDTDWHWIVYLNGEACQAKRDEFVDDPRVTVISVSDAKRTSVGTLKKAACDLVYYLVGAPADYEKKFIVELDHDDELSIDCLAELRKAFDRPSKPCFVYSNCASVNEDGSMYKYGAEYGWTYKQNLFRGHAYSMDVAVPNQCELFAQNICRIYYAPNHVRAWRLHDYLAVGGHNPEMAVCDDLDLMCRLYQRGNFEFIDQCLYLYRVHKDNTWLKNQQLIDKLNTETYDRYIYDVASTWSFRQNLMRIDLGGGIDKRPGWIAVDLHHGGPTIGMNDVVTDLNQPWPFKDNSVGVIRAHDVIEHLKDPIHVMNEAHRVLVHGGLFLIEVPSTDGRGAFQDPSHVSFWNTNSFWYYTRAQQQRYIKHLGVKCRFQQVRIANHYPSTWHQQHHILYAKSHLAAIKTGPTLHGTVEI